MLNPRRAQVSASCAGSALASRHGPLFALLAEFAHDLRDVHGAAGRQLGPLLLLHLPHGDGAEAGPPLLRVLLQLAGAAGTEGSEKEERGRRREGGRGRRT